MGFNTNAFARRSYDLSQREAPSTPGRMVGYNPLADRRAAQADTVRQDRDSGVSPNVKQIFSNFYAANTGLSPQPKEQSQGLIGSVLNSTAGGGIMKVLDYLDYGRRAVTLGVEEFAEGVTGDEFSMQLNEDGSQKDLRSNMDKLRDPTYGVGQLLSDVSFDDSLGNVFDKGVGLAGDIAFDPLTYLTLGVGKAAGLGGRAAAGTKLLDSAKKSGGVTARNLDDIRKIGRFGVSGVDDAARRLAMGDDAGHGVRFMGQKIAGTGKLAQNMGRVGSKGRVALSDAMPAVLRERGFSKELIDARRGLQQGTGNVTEHLTVISARQNQKKAFGLVSKRLSKQQESLSKNALKDPVDDVEVSHRIEMASPKAGGDDLYDETKKFFKDNIELTQENTGTRLVDGVETPVVQATANYFPRKKTDELFKAEALANNSEVNKFFGVGTEATGSAKSRVDLVGQTHTNPSTGAKFTFFADTPQGTVSLKQLDEGKRILYGMGDTPAYHRQVSKAAPLHMLDTATNISRADSARRVGQLSGLSGSDAFDTQLDSKATRSNVAAGQQSVDGNLDVMKGRSKSAQQVSGGQAQEVRDKLVTQYNAQVKKAESNLAAAKKNTEKVRKKRLDESPKLRAKAVKEALDVETKAASSLKKLQEQGDTAVRQYDKRFAKLDEMHLRDKKKHDAARKREQRKIGPHPKSEGLTKHTKTRNEKRATAKATLDQKLADIGKRMDDVKGVRTEAERKLQIEHANIEKGRLVQVERFSNMKDAEAAAASTLSDLIQARAKFKNKKMKPAAGYGTVERFADIENHLRQAINNIGQYEGSDVTASLMNDFAKGTLEVESAANALEGLNAFRKGINNKTAIPVMKDVIRTNVDVFAESLLGDDAPIITKRLKEALEGVERAIDDDQFFSAWDTYTRFFKTYATMTPGFHLRNGMSATFMNAVDGVSLGNMKEGVRMWVASEKNPNTWTDTYKFQKGMDKEKALRALDGVYGSGGGGGQYSATELGGREAGKILSNKLTRASKWVGSMTEGGVRMGMAIDSAARGDTFEDIVARITRTHFDYSDVSKMDVTLKRIIPFWTFLSRNVPLQMQQMFMKPKMYAWYDSFVRNMGEGEDGELLPKRWRENGAFQLTDGIFAQPDLAHIGLREDLEALTLGLSENKIDPSRMASSSNPLLKVPFETAVAGKNTFTGREFRDDQFVGADSSPDLKALMPLLKAIDSTGLTDLALKGGKKGDKDVLSEKTVHALRGLVPFLGQIQRLSSSDPYYASRRNTQLASYFGLPVKFLDQGELDAEARRKSFDVTDEDKRKELEAALAAFMPR